MQIKNLLKFPNVFIIYTIFFIFLFNFNILVLFLFLPFLLNQIKLFLCINARNIFIKTMIVLADFVFLGGRRTEYIYTFIFYVLLFLRFIRRTNHIADCIVSTQHQPLTETRFPNNHSVATEKYSLKIAFQKSRQNSWKIHVKEFHA